jgi:hypothetical protein
MRHTCWYILESAQMQMLKENQKKCIVFFIII